MYRLPLIIYRVAGAFFPQDNIFSKENHPAAQCGRLSCDSPEKEKGDYVKRSPRILAPRPGLEPGTCGLTVRRSTD